MVNKRQRIKKSDIAPVVSAIHFAILERLDEHGDHSFASTHEILGVVQEEDLELVEAVRTNDIDKITAELTDIAVAATFALACIRAKGIDW